MFNLAQDLSLPIKNRIDFYLTDLNFLFSIFKELLFLYRKSGAKVHKYFIIPNNKNIFLSASLFPQRTYPELGLQIYNSSPKLQEVPIIYFILCT